MEFLRSITEAYGFHNDVSGLNNYSPEDLGDMFYLHILALVIMIQNKLTVSYVKEYCDKVLVYKNFKRAYTRLNDVGFMAATLLGNNAYYNNNGALTNTLLESDLIHFFRMMRGDFPITEAQVRTFLMKFEKALDISNDELRSVRRRALQLTRTKYELRKFVYKDTLRRLRLFNLRSEIIPQFKRLLPDENKKSDNNIAKSLAAAGLGVMIGTHLSKKS